MDTGLGKEALKMVSHPMRERMDFKCDSCACPVGLIYEAVHPESHPWCHGSICTLCAIYAEHRFIEGMPFEDLPLWVSHEWFSYAGDRLYRSRLLGER